MTPTNVVTQLMSDQTLLTLAQQLRCPQDRQGIALGHTMNMANLSLILTTIHHLNLSPYDRLLELGHGNAGHLSYLLSLADNLCYTGLEVSDTMYNQSRLYNQAFIDAGLANFYMYDGKNILLPNDEFNQVFSVNTIYFWDEPQTLIQSIARVLKSEGLLVLTFCDKAFMQQLPFVKFGFHLYDQPEMAQLFSSQPFKLIEQIKKQDKSISKTGKLVDRIYYTHIYQKR